MRLGVCYNVWDAEELLEKSVQSIREGASYIVVVWQRVSNFGTSSPNPFLEEFLQSLVAKKLVDELVFWTPRQFATAERQELTTTKSVQEIGGSVDVVGNQFFNEIGKRELGRQYCLKAGCTHFMSMDTDEFYLPHQLEQAKQEILVNDYDATACRMRIIFKDPIYEYFPYDDTNAVPFICKCRPESPFRLAEPYSVMLDPTRRIANVTKFWMFPRHTIEMYHMSFVRKDMGLKLNNTSNRANLEHAQTFLDRFAIWTPDFGVIHPHPYIGALFKEIRTLPNYFNVDLSEQCALCCTTGELKRCGKCKKMRYCSQRCQVKNWPQHKLTCVP